MERGERGLRYRAPDEGKTTWMLGNLYGFPATSEVTGGTFASW